MISRYTHLFTVVGAFCLLGWSTARAQSTGQVYQIKLTGSIVHSADSGTNTIVVNDTVTTARLTNLARGRSPESAVPANEVLAVVMFFVPDGSATAALIVYDTAGHSSLATIVDFGSVSGAVSSTKGTGYIAMGGGIETVGNLSGGWLAITAKVKAANPTSAAPNILTLSSTALQGTIDGNDGSEDFEAIITKGKVSLAGSLGTLIAP